MEATTTAPVASFNISYVFDLIYNLFVTGTAPSVTSSLSISTGSIVSFVSTVWIIVSVVSFLASAIMIAIITYYTIRIKQIDEEMEVKHATIPESVAHAQVEHSRWSRIRELIESPQETDWRSAIIEADIMLDETLVRNGYLGGSVGERLQTANSAHFHSLQDAWDAHKVRNEIAHQGSAFQLTPNVAYRTIQQYENVFREFNEI